MITVKSGKVGLLSQELKEKTQETDDRENTDLDKQTVSNLNNLFSANETTSLIANINAFNGNKDYNYEQLCELDYSMDSVVSSLRDIKNKVDMDIFFKDGYTIDIKKVEEKFKAKKLRRKYPDFNFKRLDELYKNPPKTLIPYYDDSKAIIIDEFIFRKYVIGIIQMVLDHMDLLSVVTGGEGTGKSTHVSQLMYMVWWILTECGIIKYKFDIKDMFFNTLEKLRMKEDDFFNDPFRILALDEGNELHRQNWRDEEVSTFFQRLRRERFNQRIKFVCIPVLGELISSVVLTRVNFIIEMRNKNSMKTASLNKGRAMFYIIPRGDVIYSPAQKKELRKGDIKSVLFENLKDKNFLKGMDENILVKTYSCNGVWGFPESLYIKELKETNKTFQVSKGLKLTETESGYLYLARISLKALGIDSKDAKYSTLNKFFGRLKRYYENDPQKITKLEAIIKRKEEEKNIKEWAKKGVK